MGQIEKLADALTSRSETVDEQDRLVIPALIGVAFFLLGLIRLNLPPEMYFDEVHYVNAARVLWAGESVINREHPMLAKELIALSLGLAGNNPLGWRIGSLVAGSIGLFAFCRAVWHLYRSNVAVVVFGVLLATNFLALALARIAMLDIYMFAFTGLGCLFFIKRLNANVRSSWLLPATGLFMGLAIACKWSAVPVLLCLIAAYAASRVRSRRDAIVGGLCLGVIPLTAYFATFIPGMFVRNEPIRIADLLAAQVMMTRSLGMLISDHPYSSRWWEWPLGMGPMWLYRYGMDGAYRVIILGINPVITLAAIPAIGFGLWKLCRDRDWRMGSAAALFVVALGFWALSNKPVQFVYHYLLPSTFAIAAIACLLAHFWTKGFRWPAVTVVMASLAVFTWFYPALTAGAMKAKSDERYYAFLPGWHTVPNADKRRELPKDVRERSAQLDRCVRYPLNAECW